MSPYIPFAYMPIGVVARLTHTATGSLYAGRAAAGVITVVLLGVAFLNLPKRWLAIAFYVALTPTVFFFGGSLNPSGIEIAAAFAHVATMMRLSRDGFSSRAWQLYLATGTVLALVRPFGPIWVVMGAVMLLAISGRKALWQGRPLDRKTLALFAVLLAAVAGAVLWNLALMPETTVPIGVAAKYVGEAVKSLPHALRQTIGEFGWADTPLPRWMYVIGEGTDAALIVAALVVGTRTRRLQVGCALAMVVAFAIALTAETQLPFSFGLQGRYIMPMTGAVLLFVGHVIETAPHDRWKRAVTRGAAWWVLAVFGVLQIGGWYVNARRAAVGDHGPVWFLGTAEWSPPGGWLPWVVLLVLGTGCVIASVARAISNPSSSSTVVETVGVGSSGTLESCVGSSL